MKRITVTFEDDNCVGVDFGGADIGEVLLATKLLSMKVEELIEVRENKGGANRE